MDFQNWLEGRFGRFLRDDGGFLTVSGTAPAPSGGTITLNAPTVTTQPILVAPAPIWLEVDGVTGAEDEAGNAMTEVSARSGWDPTYHKVTYVWTVEEETSPGVWTTKTGSYPRVINMPTAWNEAYVAYGKRVAFRLPETGTYRFRVWCVDMQGNTGESVSSSVTIITPAAAFSSANTTVVALDGNFTGAPAAANQVTSVAAANAIIQAATVPQRVSFKNGDVHDQVTLDARDGYCDLVDTWDNSGATADIYAPRGVGNFLGHFYMNDSTQSLQCTFHNIGFKGSWDDTTETGDPGDAAVFEIRFTTAETKFLCYNCDFTGLGTTWLTCGDPFTNNTVRDVRFMIADCINTSFRNYGFYSYYNNGGEYDFLGCSIYRSHDALAGPSNGAKVDLRNDHGPVRLTSYQHTYMACCDFFGCSGWSAGPFGPSANGNVRMFAGTPETSEIPSSIVDRCVNEGGYITWKHDGQDENAPSVLGNWLYDKVLTMGTARTHYPWSTSMGGLTRRNCYTWGPNTAYYDRPTGVDYISRFLPQGSTNPASNFTGPMLDYNNTDAWLPDDTVVPLTDGNETAFATYVRQNSVNHQPNAGAPVTTFAPINTNPATEAVPGVTPRFSAVRWNYALIDLGITSLANGADVTISYPDSSDGLGNGDLTQTDQAYWQALPGSDNQHAISFAGSGGVYYASRGDFTVAFEASVIRITNTSGDQWTQSGSPAGMWLHLDRKSRLTTDIPPQTQYASPTSVPMPRPQSGSSALGDFTSGDLIAIDSFDVPAPSGTTRTRTDAGAVEAV